jgi:hypothetical protein
MGGKSKPRLCAPTQKILNKTKKSKQHSRITLKISNESDVQNF